MTVREGDYMTEPIGSGYDLVFASATLNFHKDRLGELFARIYNALNPGGIFITHQDGIYAERTKPVNHIIGMLSAELCGMDLAMPKDLIGDLMIETGFKRVRSFSVNSYIGEMDIDIGRK